MEEAAMEDEPMDEAMEPEPSGPKINSNMLRTGPFASGTFHRWVVSGQPPPIGVEFPDEKILPFAPSHGIKRKGSAGPGGGGQRGKGRGGSTGRRGGRSALTLKDLLDANIISAGRNKIGVVYKGQIYSATLNKDGQILYQGKKFMSATAFSIHCKRQLTPNKQGDDGWKSVQYEGQPLEYFRRTYYSLMCPEEGDEPDDTGPPEPEMEEPPVVEPPVEEPVAEVAEGADTDQWVQCDRCRSWRIVPDEGWPSVQEDTRDVWFCEDANWDVALYVPFTKPCSEK